MKVIHTGHASSGMLSMARAISRALSAFSTTRTISTAIRILFKIFLKELVIVVPPHLQ